MNLLLLIGLLFGSLVVFMLLGIPVALAMGGLSIVLGYIFWGGEASLIGFVMSSFEKVSDFTFAAVPLYVLMAAILQYSKLADGMFDTFYKWFGGLKGGLGVASSFIGAIFAAMVGTSSVATATLGVTARPSMVNKGYDEKFTAGVIMAASNLGIIIPPSIIFIIYAMTAGVSPGVMFMAGIIPGFLILLLLIVYSVVYSMLNPGKAPSIPKEERFTWSEKFKSLKEVILPILLILAVILSIFLGIATPTEAAGVGVLGAFICAAINRSLTFESIKKMLSMTVRLSAMMFWLVIGASAYAKIITITNIGKSLSQFVAELNFAPLLIIVCIIILYYILGMFLDAAAVMFITVPVFLPLLLELNIDLIWFGIIFTLTACVGNLTPPFGMSLFVYKGVVPEVPMKSLWSSAIPFIGVYTVGIIIILLFPQIVLWLPSRL